MLVFKHALTQDVAYDSLLARTRRELHLAAAQALAGLYGEREDLAATFAYHYARTDLVDEAVLWLTRAADQAARVYANAEAILHLDLAARRLQRLAEGVERDRRMLDVALRHAHSLYFLGRFRDSVQVLLPHDARLARINDAALTASYSFWLAHMYSRLGDQRRAAESAHRAIAAAAAAGDEATLGKAHGVLALESHWAGTAADGIAHGKEAVKILEPRVDQRWWLGMAHFYLSTNYLLEGDFESALAEAVRADSVGKSIADPRLQTYAAFVSAWADSSRGHYEAAIAQGRRGLQLAPDRVSRAYASLFLAYALLERGDFEEAGQLLGPIVAELEGFSFPQWHGLASTLLGEASRMAGRTDEAAALVENGLQITTSAGYWYGVAFSQRVIGRITRDSAGASADCFQRAAETFERIGAAFEAGRTRLELAESASRCDGSRARRELASAIRVFEALDVPVYSDRAARLAAALRTEIA